ncbi:hypothetical protein H2204_015565 [Knufia peltigerae]|uniref:N-sulphoglucosamine sulphohydrolase C-terminal domain-containing protein n=1 Tax=Knufia peltigerae TaxID=1002370 RepID=A0AA39CIH2_9EURO|nr:hypothetical protein H2204_015565 [Knufia peltigerae]
MIRLGSVNLKDIICNVDFAPTFCDLAGLKVPSYMQGVSFRPLLQGQTPSGWQQYNDDLGIEGAIPGGTEPWWELFDCDEDPLELLNIYHDPKYKDVVKEMTELLETKMMEIGDVTLHPRFQ